MSLSSKCLLCQVFPLFFIMVPFSPPQPGELFSFCFSSSQIGVFFKGKGEGPHPFLEGLRHDGHFPYPSFQGLYGRSHFFSSVSLTFPDYLPFG